MRDSQCPPRITLTFGYALCRTRVRELNVLSDRIKHVEGVQSVITRLDLHGPQKLVVFGKAGVELAALLRCMAAALREPLESEDVGNVAATTQPDPLVGSLVDLSVDPASAPGSDRQSVAGAHNVLEKLRQFTYGVLAAASIGMAWVGLLVPGIPTVPFVILAAALAAKSSPAFHQRLRKARVFGPMIRDWETHHAIRPLVKIQAIILTIAIVTVTLLVSPPSPRLYALIGAMFIFSMLVISQIPVISVRLSPRENSQAAPF